MFCLWPHTEIECRLPDTSFQTGAHFMVVGFYQNIFKDCFLPDTSFQTWEVGSSQPDKMLSGGFYPKIFCLVDSSRHLLWEFNPIFCFGGTLQTENIFMSSFSKIIWCHSNQKTCPPYGTMLKTQDHLLETTRGINYDVLLGLPSVVIFTTRCE